MSDGAMQAVMEELLSATKDNTALLTTLVSKYTGSKPKSSKEGESELPPSFFKSVGEAAGMLSTVFDPAIALASTGLSNLVTTGKQLIQAQVALSQGAIDGTNSLSSLTAGLTNLPFGLGLVAQAMTYQTKVLETNIKTYQNLSTVGARFGGNLDEVRQSAKSVGLSMDEFANMMKTNAPNLRYFGDTVSEGAANLVSFNKNFIMSSNGAGKSLLAMGFSLEEANNMLGTYASTIGGLQASQMKDQKGMEQSVKAFAIELDASAQLEGKSREQKAQEMKEANQNAAVQNKLSTMSADEVKKYNQAINAAGRIGGKGAQEYYQAMMLGIPPQTEAAKQFAALNGQAADHVANMEKIQESNLNGAAARDALTKEEAGGIKSQADFANNNKTLAAAISTSGGKMSGAVNAAIAASTDMNKRGQKSEQDIIENRKKIAAEQDKASKSAVGDTVQAQARAKYTGDLMNMLADALKPLFPVITGLFNAFMEFAPKIIGFGKDILDDVILPLFENLFGDVKLDDVVKPFKDFFKGLFGQKFSLGTLEKQLEAVLGPLVRGIEALFAAINWEAVGAGVRETFDILLNVGEVAGKVLLTAINITVGVFEVLAATTKVLFEALNWFLDPIYVLADVLSGPVNSAFSGIGNLLSATIIPFFNTLGDKLSVLAEWINNLSITINGPLKVALDFFKIGIFTLGTVMSIRSGWIAAGNALEAIRNASTAAGTIIQDAFTMSQLYAEAATAALTVGLAALSLPVIALIAGVTIVAGLMYELYEKGYSFSTFFDTAKNKFADWLDAFAGFIDDIRGLLPAWAGGLSAEQKKINADQRAIAAEKRKTDQAAIDAKVAATAKERNAPAKSTGSSSSSILGNILSPQSTTPAPNPAAKLEKEKPKNAPITKQDLVASTAAAADVASNPASSTSGAASNDPTEILKAEIETLNNSIRALLRVMTDTADNTKKTATILASGGNLFKR